MKQNRWTSENVPDLTGKIIIVTGANSGIGFETVSVLAQNGAKVIMACRNKERAFAAQKKICETAAVAAELVPVETLDLSSLKSIDTFADKIHSRFSHLDILINNAGVMVPPLSRTEDGFELQMGINHLGHFALTSKLIKLILKKETGRIVNVSSLAHKAGDVNFEDLNWNSKPYNKVKAYAQSKLANLLFSLQLQNRLKAAGKKNIVTSSHPGWTDTNLMKNLGGAAFFASFMAMTPHKGALPTLRAAIDPDAGPNSYFGPAGLTQLNGYPVKVKASKNACNEPASERLWELSEKAVNLVFNI